MTLQRTKISAQNSDLSKELSDRTIDGPKAKGLRRLLRVFYIILQPTNYMDDNVQRYGPTFQIDAESESPLVYVGDPEMVRQRRLYEFCDRPRPLQVTTSKPEPP